MLQITTNYKVDSDRFGHWLRAHGGELVGCDSNENNGEYMLIVRAGTIDAKLLQFAMDVFKEQ